MSSETPPRGVEGTIALAAVLTAVAGFVDAHILVHVTEVFVANQSGNVVLFGIFLGEREVAGGGGPHLVDCHVRGRAWPSARPRPRPPSGGGKGPAPRPDPVRRGGAARRRHRACGSIDGPHPGADRSSPSDYPVIVLGALAMGLQTVVIGRVVSVAVATTYESGAVARVRRGGRGAGCSARVPAVDQRRRHTAVLRVLLIVVASYAAGATLAAAAKPESGLAAGPRSWWCFSAPPSSGGCWLPSRRSRPRAEWVRANPIHDRRGPGRKTPQHGG